METSDIAYRLLDGSLVNNPSYPILFLLNRVVQLQRQTGIKRFLEKWPTAWPDASPLPQGFLP